MMIYCRHFIVGIGRVAYYNQNSPNSQSKMLDKTSIAKSSSWCTFCYQVVVGDDCASIFSFPSILRKIFIQYTSVDLHSQRRWIQS